MSGSQSSAQQTQGEENTAELSNQSNKNQNIKALIWFWVAMQY